MSYSIAYSTKSGLGKPALEVYLYGCDKEVKCSECHNKELWEKPNNLLDRKRLASDLRNAISGFQKFHKQVIVSFVGGEPTAYYNIEDLKYLSEYVKRCYEDSITILYSWRKVEEHNVDNLKYIDYGVLGEYCSKCHVDFQIPSSNNQVIYDFKNKVTVPVVNIGSKERG